MNSAPRKPGQFFALFTLILGLCGCTAPKKAAPESTAHEPIPLAAETFDKVWQIINDYHFDTKFNGHNWTNAAQTYRPRALAARSSDQFHQVIQEMLDLLDVSHLAIIPGDLASVIEEESTTNPGGAVDEEDEGPGNPGLTVRVWKNSGIVTQVRENSPAEKAGVKPGWVITKIKSTELKPRLQKIAKKVQPTQALFLGWKMVNGLLNGAPGSSVKVQFRDGSNKLVDLDLKRIQLPGTSVQLGSLPELYADLSTREITSSGGRKIGLIHFNMWMLPNASALDKAVEKFRKHDAIILDLRGNIGGVAGMVMGAAGHFVNEPLSLGVMKMRDNQMTFPVNPRRVNPAGERVEPFVGPLAILTDEISVSASELFAGALQEMGRARVFGQPTTGQALPAIHDKLPNGDVLYHPFGDFITAKGGRIEGRGVVPDVRIALDRKALLAGKDAVLEAALGWIEEQKAK